MKSGLPALGGALSLASAVVQIAVGANDEGAVEPGRRMAVK